MRTRLVKLAATLAMLAACVGLTFLIAGCVTAVKPETVTAGGTTYTLGPPLAAQHSVHADGTPVPDLTPAQLADMTAAWERERRTLVPLWGCTALDWTTTLIALAHGAVEANPLGLLAVPIAIAGNVWAQRRARDGHTESAWASSAVHCTAAVWNLGVIL